MENQAEVQDYITRESIQKAASGIEALKEIAQDMTENSIGNLLLFYKNNNSEHGNKLPEIKRRDDFLIPQSLCLKAAICCIRSWHLAAIRILMPLPLLRTRLRCWPT